MTTARYTGHVDRAMEILQDGRVIAKLPVEKFCAIDCELAETAAYAMEQPGTAVPVPNSARLPRPRHSVRHGIAQ